MLKLFQNAKFQKLFAWAVFAIFIPGISALAIKQAIPKDEVEMFSCFPTEDIGPFPTLDPLF